MHGQHSGRAKGPSIIVGCVIQYLLRDHARVGAISLPWPTAMAFGVNVGHCGGVLLM